MTVWKALKTPQLGVVIYNYHGKGMYQLQLQLGETVQILEESSGWYRGFSLRKKANKGIFPKTYIYVKNDKDESSSEAESVFKEEALVEELTSVLREWGAMWKQVYLRREEALFHDVKKLMLELMDWRRQILAKALPVDQLKQLKQKVTQTIDYGNRTLGLDLVVRDPEANIIDPDSTGVIELYRRHVTTSNRIKTTSRIETPKKEVAFYTTHSVYANIKLVVCNTTDDAQVFLSLYDAKEERFISEQYLVAWDRKGMPKDIDRLNNLTVLFTDLGAKDLKREQVYIVCQIVRVGRMDIKETDSKKLTHNLRRPFGIGLFSIGDLFNGTAQYDEDKEHFLQLLPIPENQSFDSWIKRMIAQPSEGNKSGQGIHISLKLLSGDVEQIREEHPLLITKQTCIARKLGFPEVIMPGDLRNDLYLTLHSGEFERGRKTANKNIEVTMEVLSDDGKVLENVISVGAGEELVSQYRSVIFYHSGKPEWVETIKLVIPIEQFQGSHVRFLFKHRSANEEKDRTQKIFAFSHTKLMYNDGTTLQDGTHELHVYKNDHGKVPHPSSYLNLPSKKDEVPPAKASAHTPTNDRIRIDTLLCSTKLTQNVDLLGLLKWNSMVGKLKDILVTVMKVSGEEIVKFLTDTFDALFAILMEHANKYDRLVFDALVFTISLLADKKYHHFRPVLDAYIEELFGATKADHILILVFLEYISYATTEQQPDRIRMDLLLKAMKAMEYIIKFIVQSRILFQRAVGDKGQAEFEERLRKLFQALVQLMADVKNETLLTQGAALKYFPATFVDLMQVFDIKELSYYAREFIERIPEKRLTSQKMDCIHHMVKTKLFEDQESRYVLLPMVVEQLKNKMTEVDEMKVCIDILNDILITLTRNDVGDTHDDVLLLVTSLLRVVVKAVITMDRSLAVVGNYVACLIAMLQLMDEKHYQKYVAHFPTDQELLDFLMEIFLLFREFVSDNIFPKDWMVMTMVQNSVILNAIQYFSEAMQEHFGAGGTFETQLWNNFFHLAVAFVTQESLQLENFSTTKQDKILEKYADMRMIIGLKISEMWHLLGDHKSYFIPGLVGPFLEMTLIPHSELRRATIPIFFDMIQCECANKGNFTSVESEIISKLDVLVEGGKGDAQYKDLFYKILSEMFNPMPPQFKEDGVRFVGLITKLMERLLDYRTVVLGDDNIDNRMSCTVNVLNFYNEIKKDEMYDRYVYKLCDLHLSVENYTEAAFTLLRRADDLQWTDETVFSSQQKYRASTQRQLKEMLYKDCIDYFDKGKCWEYAIKLCKDLANQYEYDTFDFIQLSKILEKQAGFYDNIIKVIRGEPEYFKAAFYGLGFPTFLRNKVFVYRGKEYEKIAEFIVRLQSQYPSAQILKMKDAITNDIKHSQQQFLQINRVEPVPVERRKFQGKNVLEQITKFYEVNNVNKFQFSRAVHKGEVNKENEFSTLWLERTTIYTKFTFPGILCWFEATAIDTEELSPVQNALETMESTNKQLRAIIARHKVDPNLNVNPLSMKLQGIIDAAVMGGVSNYEKAFLTPAFVKENPDSADYVERLKSSLVEQVEILEEGMGVHGNRITAALKPLHENLEKRFKEMKSKTAPFKRARISTISKPRAADGSPAITGRSMTTVRRTSERPVLSVRDSLDKMHQSYSDWSDSPTGNPPPLPTKTLPSGVRSRAQRRATVEISMTQLTEEFMTPNTPTSEIAPPKPPRPAPQAHQLPELPQKASQKKSSEVQHRSSTESSGSDGTEPVEQTPALPPRTSTMAKPKDSPPVPPKHR
ncbi:dedicator of cytokinesis protein 1-like [Porites lutea]|uniref:dedicator of cytokinesis protein 1-like n=1 Tax=Porites lutea TaxID=51062 RepID=UPI003CC6ACA3